jgi:hypothetical protein
MCVYRTKSCIVCYDFRMITIFSSSLPSIVCIDYVLFIYLLMNSYVQYDLGVWVTRRLSYKKQELLHGTSRTPWFTPGFKCGFVLLIFLVLCCIFLFCFHAKIIANNTTVCALYIHYIWQGCMTTNIKPQTVTFVCFLLNKYFFIFRLVHIFRFIIEGPWSYGS